MNSPTPPNEERMKFDPEDADEIEDVRNHVDGGNVHISVITHFPPLASLGFVEALRSRVMREADDPATHEPNTRGNVRSQHFEEGPTYMAVEPVMKDGKTEFPSSVYLMNFYDVNDQPVCSRMHKHTGLRLIFIATGPDSKVNISSLSPIITHDTNQKTITDAMPGLPPGVERERHTFVVPPNSYVAVQIPVGTSHQFNTFGPNAVITSVHPEEEVEVGREDMRGPNMMKQTIWLQNEPPPVAQCSTAQANAFLMDAGKALTPQLLGEVSTLFTGEKLTSHDMARLLSKTTGSHFTNRDVFGVYSDLMKSPHTQVEVLTSDGLTKKPISDVISREKTVGDATTILLDACAAPAVYERLQAQAKLAQR